MKNKNKPDNIGKGMRSVNPGQILRMELVEGRKLSIEQIATTLKVDPQDVLGLLNGILPISQDIAKKLAFAYGGTPAHFKHLQDNFDSVNKKQ